MTKSFIERRTPVDVLGWRRYLLVIKGETTMTTYRILPSTLSLRTGQTFRWTSEHEQAGNGNDFATLDEVMEAASAMDRSNRIEGGEWLIAARQAHQGPGVYTML